MDNIKRAISILIIIRLIVEISYIQVNLEQFIINSDSLLCFIKPRCGTSADLFLTISLVLQRLFNLFMNPLGIIGLIGYYRQSDFNKIIYMYLSYFVAHFSIFGFWGLFRPFYGSDLPTYELIQIVWYNISSIGLLVVIIYHRIKRGNDSGLGKSSAIIKSKKIRLINYLIDFGIILIFSKGIYLSLHLRYFDVEFTYVIILIKLLYYLILELLFGFTIGKLFTNTMVHENSIGRIILRTISRFIPLEPFSYLNKDGIGWHDKISKTALSTTANKKYT